MEGAPTSRREDLTCTLPSRFRSSLFGPADRRVEPRRRDPRRRSQGRRAEDLNDFGIQDEPLESVDSPPSDGAYVHGLFLEGARWDADKQVLAESRPKELTTELPIVHLLPIANRKAPKTGFYMCPIYKTLSRFGVLSTTGHSTNFVMTIEVPSDQKQAHWIKRGVAGFAALNF